MQATGIYPQANHSIMLPWATGRMCWTMITDSSVFKHASPRRETVVAGPSEHAHALLTFVRIFKSFDVEKWTLICIVWLVGADHHIVFEVLVAASRHGLSFASEHTNSLDFYARTFAFNRAQILPKHTLEFVCRAILIQSRPAQHRSCSRHQILQPIPLGVTFSNAVSKLQARAV